MKSILSFVAISGLAFAAHAGAIDARSQDAASSNPGIMNAKMDEGARRVALKKLFAQPHFRKTDGLDSEFVDRSKGSGIGPYSIDRSRGPGIDLDFIDRSKAP